jgi:platelet-activating factor acetylhydrolase
MYFFLFNAGCVSSRDDWHNFTDPLPLRSEQLAFRRHEIYLAFMAFRKFVKGCNEMDLRILDVKDTIDVESWRNSVNCEGDIALVGHSFGGATVASDPTF